MRTAFSMQLQRFAVTAPALQWQEEVLELGREQSKGMTLSVFSMGLMFPSLSGRYRKRIIY